MTEQASITISAVDQTTGVLKKIGAGIDQLEGQFGTLATAVTGFAALGAGAFATIITNAIDGAGSLHDMAQQTGATVESLSAMKGVAQIAGAEMSQVAGGLGKLSKNMLEAAQGTGEAAKVFGALGIKVTDASGHMKTSDAVMVEFAKSLQTVSSGSERAAAAQIVLGKSGAQLMPLLNDLAAGGELQAKITTSQAAAADQLGDTMVQLQIVYKNWTTDIAMDVVPAANLLAEAFLDVASSTEMATSSGKRLADDGSIKEWAMDAAKAAAFVVDSIDGIYRTTKLAGMGIASFTKSMVTLGEVSLIAVGAGFTAEGQAAIKQLLSERQSFMDEMGKGVDDLLLKPQFSSVLDGKIDEYKTKLAAYTEQVKLVRKAYEGTGASVEQIEGAVKRLYASMMGSGWNYENTNLSKILNNTKTSAEAAAKSLADLHLDQMALVHKQAAAETDALAKSQAEYAKNVEALIGPLEKQAEQLEQQVEFYGMTESAIQATLTARLEEARFLAAENGAWETHLAFLDQEIEARKRIGAASSQKEFLDANKKAAEQSAKEWEKFSDDINRALTDALMRGFEDGKSFGQNFVDSLKASLKTAALKIVINYATNGASSLFSTAGNAAINGILGTSSANNGAGTNWLGTASNLNSAYSAYNTANIGYQYAAGSMSGANAAGTVFANATGTGLDGLLATNGAYGTAAVGAETGWASMLGEAASGAWVLAIPAIAGAIKAAGTRKAYEFDGLQIKGDYAGNNFTGAAATKWQADGGWWQNGDKMKQWMPLTSDKNAIIEAFFGGSISKNGYDGYVNNRGNVTNVTDMANLADLIDTPSFSGVDNSAAVAAWDAQYAAYQAANQYSFSGGSEKAEWAGGERPSAISNTAPYFSGAPGTVSKTPVLSTDPVMLGALDSAIDAIFKATQTSFKALATQFEDTDLAGKIDAFSTSINIDTSSGDINKVLAELSASVNDQMAQDFLPSIETLRQPAEAWNTAFNRVMTEVAGTSRILDLMGTSIKDAFATSNTNAIIKSVDALSQLFGGIDALSQSFGAYYSNYYSAAEQQATGMEEMSKAFAKLNLTLPTSREGFRALVDSLTLSTTEGQGTFAALMALQGAFAELTPAIGEITATANQAAKTAQAQQIGKYLDAQRAAQASALEDNISAAQTSADAAAEIAASFEQIIDSLGTYQQTLLTGSLSTLSPADQYAESKRLYDSTAAKARLGDTEAANQLATAADAFLQSSLAASSSETYARDFGSVVGTLDAVIGVADRQIPIAETQLAVAEAQLVTLNALLEKMTGGQAPLVVDNYQQAATDWASFFSSTAIGETKQTAIGAMQRISETMGMFIDSAGAGYTFSSSESPYALASVSDAWRQEMLTRYGQWQIPAFASGGQHAGGLRLVGENGPELEFTGPSNIINSADTSTILQNGSSMVAELRALRAEVNALRAEQRAGNAAIASTTGRTARTLEKFDIDGLPETRAA